MFRGQPAGLVGMYKETLCIPTMTENQFPQNWLFFLCLFGVCNSPNSSPFSAKLYIKLNGRFPALMQTPVHPVSPAGTPLPRSWVCQSLSRARACGPRGPPAPGLLSPAPAGPAPARPGAASVTQKLPRLNLGKEI